MACNISKPYTCKEALTDLRERTQYEAWLLEEICRIADIPLTPLEFDAIVYPPNGAPHTYGVVVFGDVVCGDWRPAFLNAGAPLVFVTGFKLLDMLIEWVLAQNGIPLTFQLTQKISAIKGPVLFPPLIETRVWLRERLIALYEQLEPLRGTVIHARHFKAENGVLHVSSSKRGTIGPIITIEPSDLRNIALVLVSLLRFLDGAWVFDSFRELHLRFALDNLAHLHGLPLLGQLTPAFLNVRLYVPDGETLEFDLERIRNDVANRLQGYDVVFNVRIIAVASCGTAATAFVIPWELIRDAGTQLRKTREELACYITPLPTDVDVSAAARDMNLEMNNR